LTKLAYKPIFLDQLDDTTEMEDKMSDFEFSEVDEGQVFFDYTP